MKRKKKPLKDNPEDFESKVEEPLAVYGSVHALPVTDGFSYKKFEKIAALTPFTQKEWGAILHLSEKTLQRYARDNSFFEGIYADRILHLGELIDLGKETFTDMDAFYRWLKREKNILGVKLDFTALTSTKGIQLLMEEMGRIQQGIFI
ncbi:antitoxin Xre-like helix-turn-helix domain-containing protein [Agriterribacter sp.]|uniref:type II RES/Xre toxin-antitoxin system antitoxin n=1 Tax=Agriterribacter sp. TaxID=2821509 RepID=UPI002CCAD1E6|nr:antitoxin Xre-like helix-turn-helix domain-containing protein [Agriterribacter sp.]HRO47428.1 hypothetical protein [Agriterribacter sp.]HRQ15915.1 hypothetical protein [Agriterribacter sp.]